MNIYGFLLTPWFWFALTVIFVLIELACSFNLITIWFAISSFLMVFISGLTELFEAPIRFRLHLGIFLLIAVILLIFTRPVAVKKLKIGKEKTNVDSLLGKEAIVTKKIVRFASGEIKLEGKYWTAVSDNNEEIEEGQVIKILRFEGVKAIVGRS